MISIRTRKDGETLGEPSLAIGSLANDHAKQDGDENNENDHAQYHHCPCPTWRRFGWCIVWLSCRKQTSNINDYHDKLATVFEPKSTYNMR